MGHRCSSYSDPARRSRRVGVGRTRTREAPSETQSPNKHWHKLSQGVPQPCSSLCCKKKKVTEGASQRRRRGVESCKGARPSFEWARDAIARWGEQFHRSEKTQGMTRMVRTGAPADEPGVPQSQPEPQGRLASLQRRADPGAARAASPGRVRDRARSTSAGCHEVGRPWMDGLRLYVEYKGAQDRRRRRGRHETFTAHTGEPAQAICQGPGAGACGCGARTGSGRARCGCGRSSRCGSSPPCPHPCPCPRPCCPCRVEGVLYHSSHAKPCRWRSYDVRVSASPCVPNV